ILNWYSRNFDHYRETPGVANTLRSRHGLLVSTNAVSNLAPVKKYSTGSAIPMGSSMPDWPAGAIPAKANANTASFEELWRAYWQVMTESGTDTPYGI